MVKKGTAARNLAAQLLELARVLEEVDQFAHFLLGFFNASHVGKGDLHLVGAEHARLALAKRHGTPPAAPAALHLAHEVDPHTDQQQNREGVEQQLQQQRRFARHGAFELDVVLDQRADHRTVVGLRADGGEGAAALQRAGDGLVLNDHVTDVAVLHLIEKVGVGQFRLGAAAARKALEHAHQHDENDHP